MILCSQGIWRRVALITLLMLITLSCSYIPETLTQTKVSPSPTNTPVLPPTPVLLEEGEMFSVDNLALTFLEHSLEGCYVSKYGNEICPDEGASLLWVHFKRENMGTSSDMPIYSCFWFFLQYHGERLDSLWYHTYSDYHPDRPSWIGGGCEQLYSGNSNDGWIVFEVPTGIVLGEAILRVESYEGPKFEQLWEFGE
jgi:hypothetical protein